jgi:long-chain fatty acid transport protein
MTAAGTADAAGFYVQEQSVKGFGRANSGEVADQGPSSLWWNPAAIAGTRKAEATFGAIAIVPRGEVDDAGTQIDRPGVPAVPVGGAPLRRNPILSGAAPNSAFAIPLGDRIAIGLAITSPFSFTSDYDPAGRQRYSAIRSRLLTLDVQPSLAVAATDWLSVGAALNVEYSDAWLSNALPNLAPNSPDGRLRLTGSGWDLGWSAGLQLRPSRRATLGIAYKSAVKHKIEGPVEISGLAGPLASRNVKADTVARFTTPWQLIVGARLGLGKDLTLNAQATRFGWSKFDRIEVAAPVNNALEQNYKNTWALSVGIDQELGDRLTVRAGIQVDPTPTRDVSRIARVPDGDRIDFTTGATFKMSDRFAIDAAAGYVSIGDIPISRDEHFYVGTPAQVDILTEGRGDKQRVFVLGLGGRLSF